MPPVHSPLGKSLSTVLWTSDKATAPEAPTCRKIESHRRKSSISCLKAENELINRCMRPVQRTCSATHAGGLKGERDIEAAYPVASSVLLAHVWLLKG
eukprot:scaffold91685_cov19-Tisochrysis_lutea.AAC.3